MPFLLLIFLSSLDTVSTLLLAKFAMSLSDGKIGGQVHLGLFECSRFGPSYYSLFNICVL